MRSTTKAASHSRVLPIIAILTTLSYLVLVEVTHMPSARMRLPCPDDPKSPTS